MSNAAAFSIEILVVIVCLLAILYIWSNRKQDPLIHEPMIVARVDTSLDQLVLYNPYPNISFEQFWHGITSIDITTKSPSTAALTIMDIHRARKEKAMAVTVIPDTYKVIIPLMGVKNRASVETLSQVRTLSKKRVVIISLDGEKDIPVARDVFNIICNACGVDVNDALIAESTGDSDIQTDVVMVFMYGTLPQIKSFMQARERMSTFNILDCDPMDIHVIKLGWEFSRFVTIDINIEFDKKSVRYPLKRFLCFDMFIVADAQISKTHRNDILRLLSNMLDSSALALNNYYTMFIQYTDMSLMFLRWKNSKIQNRDQLQILEQFTEFEVKTNVNGFYDANTQMFMVYDADSLPTTVPKTVIRMSGQDRDFENGDYVVQDTMGSKVMLKRTVETQPRENKTKDSRYVCYGDPYIMNEGLCESRFDESGALKKRRTYWDRPCETNEECPFYQANKTYPNYRGGCNAGFCELPIGVRRLSWRRHDTDTKPVCHACPTSNLRCCDDQRVKDYAFELDFHDRNMTADVKASQS